MRMQTNSRSRGIRTWACVAACMASLTSIGCQGDYGGQTLPSPYYLTDDVQYFPPGPEFKLSREAAAMKAYREEQIQRAGVPPR